MADKMQILEIQGSEVKGTLNAPERLVDKDAIIKELKEIINNKNAIIEQQTDYIGELQNEVSQCRYKIRMLTL